MSIEEIFWHYDDVVDHLVTTNEKGYQLSKAAEEAGELNTVLLQKLHKHTRVDDQEVIDEIGDLEIRLRVLRRVFDEKKIKERIMLKLDKFRGYKKENLYKGGI